MAGSALGTRTPTSVRKCPAPSTRAAPRIQNVPRVTDTPIWGRISAGRLSSRPQPLKSWQFVEGMPAKATKRGPASPAG
jgi:hypothetical protein